MFLFDLAIDESKLRNQEYTERNESVYREDREMERNTRWEYWLAVSQVSGNGMRFSR